MTKILEQVLREAEKLPEADQQIIADMIISFIHIEEAEEAEWEALVKSPQSQRFLEKMVHEVQEEEKHGRLLPFPGDQ